MTEGFWTLLISWLSSMRSYQIVVDILRSGNMMSLQKEGTPPDPWLGKKWAQVCYLVQNMGKYGNSIRTYGKSHINGAFHVKIIYKRRMFKQTTFNWGYPQWMQQGKKSSYNWGFLDPLAITWNPKFRRSPPFLGGSMTGSPWTEWLDVPPSGTEMKLIPWMSHVAKII